MLLPTRSSPSGLSGEDSSPGTWQRRPAHCLSSGSRLQAQPQSFDDGGEVHHRLSQLGRPGRKLHTNPGCFFMAKPSAPEEALTGQLDWPRLHSFYRKESPWRLHPANQKSKVFIHSAAGRARRAPPTWQGRRAEPEPPVRNSGARGGRGLAACLRSAPPGARGAGGFRGPAHTEVGGAALLCGEPRGSPRRRPRV